MGLLAPDLSNWPAVTRSESLCEDVWAIDTEVDDCRDPDESIDKSVVSENSSNLTNAFPRAKAIQRDTFLILSATGEVVARSESSASHHLVSASSTAETIQECRVRPDWYNFIIARTTPTLELHSNVHKESSLRNVKDFIKTKDVHAFPRGVSVGWRQRVESLEVEAVLITERTALASCVLER